MPNWAGVSSGLQAWEVKKFTLSTWRAGSAFTIRNAAIDAMIKSRKMPESPGCPAKSRFSQPPGADPADRPVLATAHRRVVPSRWSRQLPPSCRAGVL